MNGSNRSRVILLLAVIYLTFISLGLPDSVLGVAFPAIQLEWRLNLSLGGVISMVLISGTILSSFFSGFLIASLGTHRITLFSTLLTAVALAGFAVAPSWIWLVLFAAPLGFGGGSVDAALNHYVALHFRAHHMNWLHAFWGLGATTGPLIMAAFLGGAFSWRTGYFSLFIIQFSVALLIFSSFSLWQGLGTKQATSVVVVPPEDETTVSIVKISRKRLPFALFVFLLYCGAESSAGLWGSSYLVYTRGISIDAAALWMALYYAGITGGRILSGFLSFRLSNSILIRMGMSISLLAALLLFLLPAFSTSPGISGLPFLLLGFGLAPVFPGMLHDTPARFGQENSARIIGLQMAAGYTGSAFIPPLAGLLLQQVSLSILPLLLIGLAAGVVFCSEAVGRISS